MLIAGAAGLVQVAAFAPFGAYPLAWLTLAVLYLLVRDAADLRAAAVLGFAFGCGAFLGGVSWVYVSLSVFGGMAAWLAVLATLAFAALLALFPALATAAAWRLAGPAAVPLAAAAAFAASWALAEGLRGWALTGFPWLAVGYSQVPASPLTGLAPVLGVYGVSLATALVGAALGEAIRRWRSGAPCPRTGHPRWAHASVPLVFAVLLLAAGGVLRLTAWTSPAGAPVRVALLQGNIAQDLKWRPETFRDSLDTYERLLREHPARLTVLPETALPAWFEALPPAWLDGVRDMVSARGGDVLLGVVTGSAERYTNSVVSLGSAPPQRYEKVHLVPFGEFVPPGFAWFMRQMAMPMSGFSGGLPAQPPLAVGGARVAVNICYEDLFGEELRAAAVPATMLVNVSNTAWFGRSLAQPQHLQIAQMRALESGRPMLRATNTGMTAVVLPDGRVDAVLPPFSRGALVADVQGMQGLTPFLRRGNLPAFGIAAAMLALVALATAAGTLHRRKSR